jgi:predicted ATPase
MNLRHIVLSGCSGGGKSTLLAELERRGFAVVPEPGRRIVEEEQRGDGLALPWVDLSAFAKRAIDLASEDRRRMVDEAGCVFFDRGLVDAAVALEYATGSSAKDPLASYDRCHQSVFFDTSLARDLRDRRAAATKFRRGDRRVQPATDRVP